MANENKLNNKLNNKLKFIVKSAQIAAVLEASSAKPGNVNPLHNFENTGYEHFLAGSLSIGDSVCDAVFGGYDNEIKTGKYILKGVSDVKKSHSGGNTHLGILMLFIPLASGCGICISENDLNFKNLQENILKVLNSTTAADSVNLCDAIKLAKAGGLGTADKFDLNNEKLKDDLIKNNLNFYDLLKLSAGKDRLAEELTTGMNITFKYSGVLAGTYEKSNDIFYSIVQTYMIILTRFPDTLIARKCGFDAAEEVSRRAEEVLKGKNSIENFDRYLRGKGNKLNPGTTADIIAACLFVAMLRGLRL